MKKIINMVWKKNIIVFLSIVIGVIIVFVYLNYYLRQKQKEQVVSLPPPPKVEVINLEKQIPLDLQEIIQEKDIQIVDSYKIIDERSLKTISLRYFSKMTPAENIDFFRKHLIKNQWAVSQESIPRQIYNLTTLSFYKDFKRLEIILSYDDVQKQTLVNLNLDLNFADKILKNNETR